MKTCALSHCEAKHYARGCCEYHYRRRARGFVDWDKPAVRRGRNGGRYMQHGYVVIHRPAHPNASSKGAVLEHVLVMSEWLGRALLAHENVHHLNGNRIDNRLENLELWSTKQPPGQRVEDKVAYAREILALYGDHDHGKPGRAA